MGNNLFYFSTYIGFIEGYTLATENFQFFYPFGKVAFVKGHKICIDGGDDILIRRGFLPSEADFEVWESEIVARGQIRRIERMRYEIVALFVQFGHYNR